VGDLIEIETHQVHHGDDPRPTDLGRKGPPSRLREDRGQRHPRATAAAEFGATLGRLGIAQRRVARLFGVTPHTVRRWRAGSRHLPCGVDILVRLLDAEVVTIDQIEAAVPDLGRTNGNGGAEPRPPAPLFVEPTLEPRAEAATGADPDPTTATTAEKVFALAPNACRPSGTPGHPDFHFCGRQTTQPPYCAEHRALAYVASIDRRPSSPFRFSVKEAAAV
jgi:hypothetical protein